MRCCVVVLAFAAAACGSSSGASSGDDGGSSGSSGVLPVTSGASLDCGGHGCGVKQLALGIIAACALLEDGTVACYGGGIVGTLGRSDKPLVDPVPQRVPGVTHAVQLVGGGYSMCAVLEDRSVTCWGPDQSAGPYGARPGERFVVQGLARVTDLAVGTSHTCALATGGDMHCFGSNYFGELGDGTLNNTKTAVKVSAIAGAKAIATGGELSCAVLADGSVSCWGLDDQGQLGQGTSDTLIHPMPTPVPGLGGPAKSVAASSVTGAVCALLEDGTAKCWGEVIPGTPASGGAALAVGGGHACVLDAAGAARCWGKNDKGQLGCGSTAPSATAVSALGITNARSLAAGGSSTCAVFEDGSFACWGDDSRGQLGSGRTGTTSPTPVRRHF